MWGCACERKVCWARNDFTLDCSLPGPLGVLQAACWQPTRWQGRAARPAERVLQSACGLVWLVEVPLTWGSLPGAHSRRVRPVGQACGRDQKTNSLHAALSSLPWFGKRRWLLAAAGAVPEHLLGARPPGGGLGKGSKIKSKSQPLPSKALLPPGGGWVRGSASFRKMAGSQSMENSH